MEYLWTRPLSQDLSTSKNHSTSTAKPDYTKTKHLSMNPFGSLAILHDLARKYVLHPVSAVSSHALGARRRTSGWACFRSAALTPLSRASPELMPRHRSSTHSAFRSKAPDLTVYSHIYSFSLPSPSLLSKFEVGTATSALDSVLQAGNIRQANHVNICHVHAELKIRIQF